MKGSCPVTEVMGSFFFWDIVFVLHRPEQVWKTLPRQPVRAMYAFGTDVRC
ncbi:hypothetical protein [Candidatus Formimonas warabiya]|uniref:hypothetical protein n=1 Tax=Formimonas warabiya TaxID=1761012 RepID=UPI001BE409E0|nr:hypothetical protein [Candidatus Formimonas warabiya]